MLHPSSDVVFTPTEKAVQRERGSRASYEAMEVRGGFRTVITPDLVAFIANIDTAYFTAANAQGQPYTQHRGGPKGFIRALGERALAFADFVGNRQYITTGNLQENDRAFLFLMDYAQRRRIKVWGRAMVVADAAALAQDLMSEGYQAAPEQAIVFEVSAWDMNCPQHIPQKLNASEVAAEIERFEARIVELEAENAALRQRLAATKQANNSPNFFGDPW